MGFSIPALTVLAVSIIGITGGPDPFHIQVLESDPSDGDATVDATYQAVITSGLTHASSITWQGGPGVQIVNPASQVTDITFDMPGYTLAGNTHSFQIFAQVTDSNGVMAGDGKTGGIRVTPGKGASASI